MKGWKLAAAAMLIVGLSGCGSGNSRVVTVSIVPPSATVVLGGTQQFTASVFGSSNTAANFSVSGSGCSGAACGTITTSGLYMAPAALPNPPTVTVTAGSAAMPSAIANATVTLTTGISVTLSVTSATVGTGEFFQITPTVSGPTMNFTVNWTVNSTANGSTTVGQICVTLNPCVAPAMAVAGPIFYLAPTTQPSPVTVSVQAASAADPSKVGTAGITVLPAVDPAVTSISPTTASQGSVFQDLILNASAAGNFFSTSTVLVNGVAVPSTFLSTTLLKARIPASSLQTAGTFQVLVERQNGDQPPGQSLTIVAQRPALVSAAPSSVLQCQGACGSPGVLLTGGYYSPSTKVFFDNLLVGATLLSANQLSASVPGTALGTPGLFPLVVQNPGAAQPITGINLAIQPSLTISPANVIATPAVGSTPSAAAVNTATGKVVVANSGDNTISVFDLNNCTSGSCPVTGVGVGKTPTGLAVDNLLNRALVVNQADNTVSVVDISGAAPVVVQTITLPTSCQTSPPPVTPPPPLVPVSIGVNPLTHHALVADQLTNCSTVLDLTLNPPAVAGPAIISTGLNPRVAIEPRLDWAIVTPGGAGSISIVDMSHMSTNATTNLPAFNNVVSPFTITNSIQGIDLNPETEQALLTDPSNAIAHIFSVLDQSVDPNNPFNPLALGTNFAAAAINPLTNVAVAVNDLGNSVSVVDMGTPAVLKSGIAVGTKPVAVAMDPVTNEAAVVNQGDGTVSVLALGTLRPLQIVQVSPPLTFTATPPAPITLTVIGSGFVSGSSVVRLDQTPMTTTFVSGRELTAQVPAAMLSGPRRYTVDVLNQADGTVSNVSGLTVIQPVAVGHAPVAVAIDEQLNKVVVTNSADNTVSLVNLATGTVDATIPVGANPEGVDVIDRLGEAVVTNVNDNTASLIDLVGQTVIGNALPVGQGPTAVAIDADTAGAVVANSISNTLSFFSVGVVNPAPASSTVDLRPMAVAADPMTNLAAVAAGTQNTVDLVNLSSHFIVGRASTTPPIGCLFQIPTGVTLDPVSDVFVVANSLLNEICIVNPTSFQTVSVRTGINPVSIAYNFQASTLLTGNIQSNTVSVMDFLNRRVQAVLALTGSAQQSVAINRQTNLAVLADQNHNQILLVPPPR